MTKQPNPRYRSYETPTRLDRVHDFIWAHWLKFIPLALALGPIIYYGARPVPPAVPSTPVAQLTAQPLALPVAAAIKPLAAHDFTIKEVRDRKHTLELSMQAVIDRAKAWPGSDQQFVSIAQQELDLFSLHFAALSMETVPEGLKIKAVDACPDPQVACFYFTVAEFDGGLTVASFNPEQRFMYTSPHVAADDAYLPFLVFHELVHVMDAINGMQIVGDPLRPAPDTAVPSETNAYRFESGLVNSYTHGEYLKLIMSAVDLVKRRQLNFVAVMPGQYPIYFVDLPRDFKNLLGLTSEVDEQSFTVPITLDINLGLLLQGSPHDVVNGPAQAFLYANYLNGLGSPAVQAVLRHQPPPPGQ